jgi:hypothetical protein
MPWVARMMKNAKTKRALDYMMFPNYCTLGNALRYFEKKTGRPAREWFVDSANGCLKVGPIPAQRKAAH